MRASSALAPIVALGALGAVQADARTDANLRITPGRRGGKVRLGMTEAQVRRAMGRPQFVVVRRGGFGLREVELQYGLATYTVRLVGPRDRLRVVRVGTMLVRERTRGGLGVGTHVAVVLRAFPRSRCDRLRTHQYGSVQLVVDVRRDCAVTDAAGRRTIFTTSVRQNGIWDPLEPSDWRRGARVHEVSVAAAA